MPMPVDQFGKAIVAAGLMPADELKALWAKLPAARRPKDGGAFAKLLIDRGQLTEFQARELLSASGAPLVLGDYVLLSKIGAGGMGQVFKAQHRHMDRLVAVKLLPAAVSKDEATVKRFQREVQAAAKLSHPNIVQAYDASVQRGVWYLVMEYVEGCDLSALSKQHGPLPVQDTVDYILQAARGLAYAHAQGVVHRDIKPANLILVSRESRVQSLEPAAAKCSGFRLSSLDSGLIKILDMGLARIDNSGDAADQQLTNSGQVMGTVDYMAPEQAASTHDADARSDLYSLGCTLFRLLTGENVYHADTVINKLMAHQTAPIPSLCQKRSEIPAEIDRIFQKLVAKQPGDRYQEAAELIADLEAWRNSIATPALSRSAAPLSLGGRGAGGEGATAQLVQSAVVTAVEPTISSLGPEIDTDPQTQNIAAFSLARPSAAATARSKRRHKPPKNLIAGGIGGLALFIVLGIWVIVRDKDGNEVSRTKVPEGGKVEVKSSITNSKSEISEISNPRSQISNPKPAPAPTGPEPPLAVAPFDAKQARAHQDAWAKHLGTTVETTNSVGAKMVLIPPGEFLMGSTDEQVEAALQAAEEIKADQGTMDRIQNTERPQHKVVISKPLLMGATEVTIGQFQNFVEASKYVTEGEQYGFGQSGSKTLDERATDFMKQQNWRTPGYAVTADYPVTQVTWSDACAFCNWLSESEQRTPCYAALGGGDWIVKESANGYRLPTEAQWEYACRAGTTTQYSFGDDWRLLGEFGWYRQTSNGRAWPVRLKRGNAYGLHDMHGNVFEWCQDFWDEKWYEKASADSPNGPVDGSSPVLRGGGWTNFASNCRSAYRFSHSPSTRGYNYGFRVVRLW